MLKKNWGLFFAGFPCCPVTSTVMVPIFTVTHPEIFPRWFSHKKIGDLILNLVPIRLLLGIIKSSLNFSFNQCLELVILFVPSC